MFPETTRGTDISLRIPSSMSQWGLPVYLSLLVLAWMVTASAPADIVSSITSRKFSSSELCPKRILTVIGTSTVFFMAFTISPHFFGSLISADPEPLRTTFGTGHPMLMSKKLIPGLTSRAIMAAFAMASGLHPKSCTPVIPVGSKSR